MNNKINKKTVAIVTLGCKVNKYESDGMLDILQQGGYEIVDSMEVADVYIINTCSVTNMAEKKSRQMLHKMKRKNEKAVIVAVGCYVNAAKEELEKDIGIDIVIGNNKKSEILTILSEYINENPVIDNYVDINTENNYEEFHLSQINDHTRAYVKIQDGCNQFCSYCIIPYVRGRVRSRSMEDIYSEIEVLVSKGIKEVVLTGIHISSYGIDFSDKISLVDLIEYISSIEQLKRIRIGSLEPRIVTEEFVKIISGNPKVCPHFHLSLQSGCNETLLRMNRKYTIEEYKNSCDILRRFYHKPAITTDIIVGFPGETQEEFATTLKWLQVLNLYEMHIFKYSVRKGTKAENMPNQVSEMIKNERSSVLLELAESNKRAYESEFVGQEIEILIEEKTMVDGEEVYTGYSDRYIKGWIKGSDELLNEIVTIIFS